MKRQEFINKFMPNGTDKEGLKIKLKEWNNIKYIVTIAVGKKTFIYIDDDGCEASCYIDAPWELYEPEEEGFNAEKEELKKDIPSFKLSNYVTKEELEDVVFTINNLNKRIIELEENTPRKKDIFTISKSIYNINMRLGDLENSRGKLTKTTVFELDNRLQNITKRIDALETQDLINESRSVGC